MEESRYQLNLSSDIAIPRNKLEPGKKLGDGGFGIVYIGQWIHTALRKEVVAIKELKENDLSKSVLQDFENEVTVQAKLQSSSIVQLYGVTLEQPYCMVMEFMKGGALDKFLQNNSRSSVSWDNRMQWALDISTGMSYLHSLTPSIIHADLKSLNVLLDENYRAKLADFGLSSIKTETASKTNQTTAVTESGRAQGSLLWMAPELFRRKAKPSLQSDIYALGMVLWEICSHKYPFHEDAAKGAQLIMQYIKDGEREEFPDDTPDLFRKIAERCWDADTKKRPSAKEVRTSFEKLADEYDVKKDYEDNINSSPRSVNLDTGYLDNLDSQRMTSSGYMDNLNSQGITNTGYLGNMASQYNDSVDSNQNSNKTSKYINNFESRIESRTPIKSNNSKKNESKSLPIQIEKDESRDASTSLVIEYEKVREKRIEYEQKKQLNLSREEIEKLNESLMSATKKNLPNLVYQALLEGANINHLGLNDKAQGNYYSDIYSNMDVHESMSPLFYSAKHGHEDVMRVLLKYGAEIEVGGGNGITPLTVAAWNGKDRVMRLLINAGAALNVTYKTMKYYARITAEVFTPICFAAIEGHDKVVEILLNAGASLAAPNQGKSPQYIANYYRIYCNGQKDIVKLLKNARKNIKPIDTELLKATEKNNIEEIGRALSEGANVNSLNTKRYGALHIAAKLGDVELLSYLIEAGVNLNLKGPLSKTALFIASEEGHHNVVKELMQSGADTSIRNNLGITPIAIAKMKKHTAVVGLLKKFSDERTGKKSPLRLKSGNIYKNLRGMLKRQSSENQEKLSEPSNQNRISSEQSLWKNAKGKSSQDNTNSSPKFSLGRQRTSNSRNSHGEDSKNTNTM